MSVNVGQLITMLTLLARENLHHTVMIAASSDDIHEHVTENWELEIYDDHIILRSRD